MRNVLFILFLIPIVLFCFCSDKGEDVSKGPSMEKKAQKMRKSATGKEMEPFESREASVAVSVGRISGVSGLEIYFNYDASKLKYADSASGKVVEGFSCLTNSDSPGFLKYGCAGTENRNGPGGLAVFKFDTLAESVSPASIANLKCVFYNDKGGKMEAEKGCSFELEIK